MNTTASVSEMALAPSVLSLFETSKAQRQSFAETVIESLREGQVKPQDIHLQIKCMQELGETVLKNETYKEILLEEVQKFGKSHEYHNAKFEVKEVGVKYDFSQCGDPVHIALKAKAEAAAKELKEREEFLKKAPTSGIELRHEDELITIYPPAKSSTTSVAVTLK